MQQKMMRQKIFCRGRKEPLMSPWNMAKNFGTKNLISLKVFLVEKRKIIDLHQLYNHRVLQVRHQTHIHRVLIHQVVIPRLGIQVARTPPITIHPFHTLLLRTHQQSFLHLQTIVIKFLNELASGYLIDRCVRKTITVSLNLQLNARKNAKTFIIVTTARTKNQRLYGKKNLLLILYLVYITSLIYK